MWSWVQENSGAVSAAASSLMLIVWLLYFQLLYLQFRQSRRSNILISIAGGPHIAAECVLANMSLAPIYIEAVAVEVGAENGTAVHSLSDLQRDNNNQDLRSSAFQGPLASGEMIAIGPFSHLLDRTGCDGASSELRFTLTVIAVYAGAETPVAAERTFLRQGDRLQSISTGARQLRSRSERTRLQRLLRASRVIVEDKQRQP